MKSDDVTAVDGTFASPVPVPDTDARQTADRVACVLMQHGEVQAGDDELGCPGCNVRICDACADGELCHVCAEDERQRRAEWYEEWHAERERQQYEVAEEEARLRAQEDRLYGQSKWNDI